MTDNVSTLRALGIEGTQYERWMEYRKGKSEKKAEPKSGVYHLDGPIVSAEMDAYYPDGNGFATPTQLRNFLDGNAGKDVEIEINSPGGSVFEANAMVSDLMRHDGNVRIVVVGACFSAAMDFLTIEGADRVAMPGSMYMIHNASTFAFGDANALLKVASRLEKMNGQCADRMAGAWKLERDELVRMMDEETWFTEAEAVEHGMVDRVWEKPEAESNEDDAEAEATAKRGDRAAIARLMAIT